ncbi:MAG: SpoIIE family protein phosphatase, partial [Acidimicrobiia bacterium]|nr:SpoIIE family protein phosphatase [Acidimicrobiia bacterium]
VLNNGATVLENEFDDQILEEAGLDAVQRSQVEEIGIQSYLVVPLRVSDRIIGTLSVGGAIGARPYGQDDLDLAERIADRAGVAIHNAIQFTQRTKIAKVLQRSLLPAGFPNIAGCQMAGTYRSAGEGLDVGGDFYDVFQIDSSRFGIAIGDVSGKGHEAAAITALTRHTIRAAAVTISNPHEVLLAANEVLLGQATESRFCTAAFGIATVRKPGHLSLRFANAGHLPPLVARLDGTIEPIESSGVLLGMFPDASFEDVSVEMKPGEVFLLYTDGLTDVMINGEFLGDDWLRAELASVRERSVGEIVRTIEERVTRSGSVLVDDVAVLAVKTVGGSA